MKAEQTAVARRCLEGAEQGTLSFPEALGLLGAHGFEGYTIEFRKGVASYFLLTGESVVVPMEPDDTPVAATFDAEALKAAIREAQAMVPGYTYRSFCDKARRAGCAGYIVSLPGRRVLYYGRTAETHTEHFPGASPALAKP